MLFKMSRNIIYFDTFIQKSLFSHAHTKSKSAHDKCNVENYITVFICLFNSNT